jgi:glucokinase
MILAGDIGGTKTNFAYFSDDGGALTPVLFASYPSGEFATMNQVLDRLLRDHPAAVGAAAFGIAGPIVNNTSKLTNLGWFIEGADVARFLNLKSIGLINDLGATAYGILRIPEEDKFVLNEGTAQPHGTIAVIAAGTGLGEGGLLWDGTQYRAIPSEGGHTDFGPRNEVEMELLRFLLKKFDRVSYERIVCGPALLHVYEFFRARAGYPEPAWLKEQMVNGDPSAVISEAGLEGNDRVCVQSRDMFVSLYGAEAGNLALKILATGGVYVGGGIAPKIIAKVKEGKFLDSFFRKGRYTNLMKNMPVHVVLNDKTALYGAAHYALMEQ